jgi:hypothetical protein
MRRARAPLSEREHRIPWEPARRPRPRSDGHGADAMVATLQRHGVPRGGRGFGFGGQSAVLRLQQTHGNAAVQRLVSSEAGIQRCGPTPCGCSPQERAARFADEAPALLLQRQETATQPPPTATFWERWGSQIEMVRRMFEEQRYGCWCGPGNVCDRVTDDIDSCCKRHDEDYAAANATSDDPAPPGKVNMWTIEGLKATMMADLRLVACTQATKYDLNFYGPAAAAYREGVALIFGLRAAAAAWLFAHGF